MQNSSKIPRWIDDTKGNIPTETESDKEKQENAGKVSLTDQGKAAKLLRKKLAFALATNSKMKSDSGTSASEASDTETTGKGLMTKEERKSSIPRKIAQQNSSISPKKKQLVEEITGRIQEDESERNGKSVVFSSLNDAFHIGDKENSSAYLQKQRETATNATALTPPNTVARNNMLSREPANCDASLPTFHEQVTRTSERKLGTQVLANLAFVETELPRLTAKVNATLKDFHSLNKEVERVKIKLEELKRERINYGA